MRRSRLWISLLVAGACTPVSTATRPVPSSAAIEVRAAADAWEQAFARKDGAAVGALFADSAVAYYPKGAAPSIGREVAIRAWTANLRKPGAYHPVHIGSITVARSGDMAWATGDWQIGTDSAGVQVTDQGKLLTVWQREAAGWRIVALSARSYAAAK